LHVSRSVHAKSVACALVVMLCALDTTADEPAQPVSSQAALDEALARRIVDEVTDEVQALRGLEFKRSVPVRVIDDAGAKHKLLERLRRFGYEERLRVQQAGYALLGLIPRASDLLELLLVALEEQAGGFYDPEDGIFYLLSDMPPQAASMLVVHELTHALEDQHYDLDARLEPDLDNEDRLFATGAVHEGSATLVMMAFSARSLRSGALAPADFHAMAETEAARGVVFGKLPPVLQRQILGPYVLGVHFLARGELFDWAEGLPQERLAQVFLEGPVSSEQILHPERYWDDRDAPRLVTLGGAGERLGKRWQRVGEGCLGELTLGVLVGAPTPSLEQVAAMQVTAAAWTNDAAAGWGGDRWELWSRSDGRQVLLLSTVWDTVVDAEQFAAALPGNLAHERRGDRVAIVAGKAGSRTPALLRAMLGPHGPAEPPGLTGRADPIK